MAEAINKAYAELVEKSATDNDKKKMIPRKMIQRRMILIRSQVRLRQEMLLH